MKRHTIASIAVFIAFLSAPALAQNYCNNPIPPCDTADPASGCYKPPDPPPKCEPKECDKCTKSPCYVGSGVYEYDEKDLEIGMTGFPITVSRLYQSSHTIDGESGYGWISSLSAHLYYAVFLKAAPNTYQREADIRLPNGHLYRFVENANGSYTPPEGRFDALVRNADGTWDLQLQRTRSRYHFAETGELLEMVDDFGNTQAWTYEKDRLSRVEDRSGSGRYIEVTWGADGRISDVTDLTKRNVNYQYDSRGVMVSATNPAGQSTAYSYVNGKYVPLLSGVNDPWGRNITTVVYDAQDRTRSYTDRGETFTYTYNYTGVATQTAKVDSSGNTWIYPFGTDGLVTESRPPGGGPAEHDEYYSNGLLKLHTDAVGVKTFHTYDSRGNPATVTYDYQGSLAVEWRTSYDVNFPDTPVSFRPFNPATNQAHPHWQGVRVEYYPPGSPAPGAPHHVFMLDADGVTERLTETFTFDSHGRLLTATSAAGHVTIFAYDTAGDLVSYERPTNNLNEIRPVTTWTRDALGRITSNTDPDGQVTTYTWDVLDRPASVTLPKPTPAFPLQFTTSFVYDEYDAATQLLFTRITDPNGRQSRLGYDQFGQPIAEYDQLGHLTGNTWVKGLLASHTDANGYVTSYTWDPRRRLSTVFFPDGTFERLNYNADDTIGSKLVRSGQTIGYTWDALKRPTATTYPNGSSITYVHQGQKLVQVVDTFTSPPETHSFTWDASFRVATEVQGTRGSIAYTWTPDGRVSTLTTSAGSTATYGYYPGGELQSISWNRAAGTFQYRYSLAGLLTSIAFPNGQSRVYSYDQQGRTTQVTTQHSAAGLLASFAYSYDTDAGTGQPSLLGLRTGVTATIPALGLQNALSTFGYDSQYRLTRATYPAAAPFNNLTSSWTYDAAGNRTSATTNGVTAGYTYRQFGTNPSNSPQLSSDGGNTYLHDANGNVASRSGNRGNVTFSWDQNDRLRAIGGDITANYLYDYEGRRTVATAGGTSKTYLYNGQDLVMENGASPAEYLYGPGVDQPLAMLRGGAIYYYAVDGVNSVAAVTDESGAVRNSYVWDAWGSPLHRAENVSSPFGYTSREPAEAGLQYYRFRTYEPAVGRFLSEDPLRQAVPIYGADLYAYVTSSPMMYGDPYGLKCYSFTNTSPWRLFKLKSTIGPWEFITAGSVRGMRFCYWARYIDNTEYLIRKVTITDYCVCPWKYLGSKSFDEFMDGRHWREMGPILKVFTNVPCLLAPPRSTPSH